jgi:hypothetical protein
MLFNDKGSEVKSRSRAVFNDSWDRPVIGSGEGFCVASTMLDAPCILRSQEHQGNRKGRSFVKLHVVPFANTVPGLRLDTVYGRTGCMSALLHLHAS